MTNPELRINSSRIILVDGQPRLRVYCSDGVQRDLDYSAAGLMNLLHDGLQVLSTMAADGSLADYVRQK